MGSPSDRHRVYMSFMDCHGWQCQFLEADLKTPLPRKLHFSPHKIIVLVERGGGFRRTIHEAYPTTDQVGQT